jgi:hypothetical protein
VITRTEELDRLRPPSLARQGQIAPSQFLVDGADHLRVRVWSSVAATVGVHGRLSPLDGGIVPIDRRLPTTADRQPVSIPITLAAGYLLNVAVAVESGTVRRGQCYATVELVRGLNAAPDAFGTMLSGYISNQQTLAYPGSVIQGYREGDGHLRTIQGSTPTLGDDWTETVPTGAFWRLASVRATLTTDATAVSRYVVFYASDASVIAYAFGAPLLLHTASRGISYVWAGGVTTVIPVHDLYVPFAAPTPLLMRGGDLLFSSTLALQAIDAWEGPIMSVEEWIDPGA